MGVYLFSNFKGDFEGLLATSYFVDHSLLDNSLKGFRELWGKPYVRCQNICQVKKLVRIVVF